jgi:hypothetical protein
MARFTRLSSLVFLFFCLPLVFAQSSVAPTASTSVKDSRAVAVAQKALAAMGGTALAEFQDVTVTGTTTLHGDTDSVSYPITLTAWGRASIRSSIQKPDRTDTYVTDGSTACFNGRRATGVAESSLDAFTRRIDFIPALSMLREYADSNVQLRYQGASSVGGRPVDVIALGVQVPGAPPGFDSFRATRRLFFVDQSNGLVLKVQHTSPDAESSTGPKIEIYFFNYQNVSGFAVPFKQATYVDGKLGIELTLQSVTFNNNIPTSDSTLTCEVADAQ